MLVIYDIIYIILALCYLPFFLIRGKYHRNILMRAGIFPQPVINKLRQKKFIWLHTVSVGEAQAASSLVKDLKQRYPALPLLISTVTKTGNKIAQKLIDPEDLVIYLPLDISFIVKKTVNLVKPKILIIAETEIWPNLIVCLGKKGIPIVLINGRVSYGSFRGYRIIRPFLKGILQKITLFCMQSKEDAQRIIELGAPREKVKVTGNMKFDLVPQAASSKPQALGLSKDEKLLIAGSTHRGEEEIILKVYRELSGNHPDLRLLIAPRHIERTKEVESLILKLGFNPQKISQLNGNEQQTVKGCRSILVLDTIGQLSSLYVNADIVFIGGSLIPHGGQNPIEPAIFAKAIIFGPYMSNFSHVSDLLLGKKAAIMVNDARQLQDTSVRLLNEPDLRQEMGERARNLVQQARGATLKNLGLISGLINNGGANESS